jgi:hypothetical protein
LDDTQSEYDAKSEKYLELWELFESLQ